MRNGKAKGRKGILFRKTSKMSVQLLTVTSKHMVKEVAVLLKKSGKGGLDEDYDRHAGEAKRAGIKKEFNDEKCIDSVDIDMKALQTQLDNMSLNILENGGNDSPGLLTLDGVPDPKHPFYGYQTKLKVTAIIGVNGTKKHADVEKHMDFAQICKALTKSLGTTCTLVNSADFGEHIQIKGLQYEQAMKLLVEWKIAKWINVNTGKLLRN